MCDTKYRKFSLKNAFTNSFKLCWSIILSTPLVTMKKNNVYTAAFHICIKIKEIVFEK